MSEDVERMFAEVLAQRFGRQGDDSSQAPAGDPIKTVLALSLMQHFRSNPRPACAAGIVRVREPGYSWFDDRLALENDPRAIAVSILANLTPTRLEARVVRIEPTLPMGAGALLALDDARVLAGAGPAEATALLVLATTAEAARLDEERPADALGAALRMRALPGARPERTASGAIVLVAPDVDAAPEGTVLLSGRPGVGERALLDGGALPADLLLLAPAQGAPPYTMPAGARWADAERALENVSRSRTLALLSDDLLANASAAARLQLGEGNASRALVAVGSVRGAPPATAWVSPAFIAGSGKPLLPRVLVAPEPGETREQAVARWEAQGFAPDR